MPKANKAKDAEQVLDAMQKTVTLDRFYDRNPWSGGKAAQKDYIRRVVQRHRAERAIVIAKENER